MTARADLRTTAEIRRETAAVHFLACTACESDQPCPTYDELSGREAEAEDAAWWGRL